MIKVFLFRVKQSIQNKNTYKLFTKNKHIFTKYLLLTNVTISIGFSGLGDYIEQMCEILSKYKTEWDKQRTLKLAVTGIPVGIICHYFYFFLDRRFIDTSFKIIFKKILLSQIICSPLCIISFYSTIGLLNKWSLEETYNQTLIKGSKLFLAECVVWPPAYVISFTFLATRHRVLYDNIISLGFNVFNSYLVHNEIKK
jgi:protein Mpv17